MSQESSTPPTAPDQFIDTEIQCLRCGYNLEGLQLDGVCPECGTHIADSHRGTLLKNSAPEYLETLHKGVFVIQAAVIVVIILAVAMAITSQFVETAIVPALFGLGILGVTVWGFYGWVQFSQPDPDYQGRNTGESVRRFVRIALYVLIATLVLDWAAGFLVSEDPDEFTMTNPAFVVNLGTMLLGIVGQVVFYVASMLYVKWLGARIPNKRIVDRAGRLTWIGPLFETVGIVLFGLGPLIALVLYWNLLDMVRKDLKAIRGV